MGRLSAMTPDPLGAKVTRPLAEPGSAES